MGKTRGIELVGTLARDKDQNQDKQIGEGKEETDSKNIYKAKWTRIWST